MATSIMDLISQIDSQQKAITNPQIYDPQAFPQYTQGLMQQFQETPVVSNVFQSLLDGRNDTIANTQNNLLGLYDAYGQVTNPVFQKYVAQSLAGGGQLLSEIDKQKQQAESLYGPQGSQYKLIDNYYTDMANLLRNRASGNLAGIDAAARASGASRGMIAASKAKQQAVDFDNLLKFQEGKNNALMNAYTTFSNLINGLRGQSEQIRSNYVIKPFLALSGRQDALAQQALENQAALEQLRLQRALTPRQPSIQDYINMAMQQQTAQINNPEAVNNFMTQFGALR